MSDGYTVNPAALEHDALQFDDWSKELDAVQEAIPVTLSSLDFSVIPGAQDVYAAYQRAADALNAYVGEGSKEFDGFARALLKSAILYLEAEGTSADDVARLNQEMDDL